MLGRATRALRSGSGQRGSPTATAVDRLDSWLEHFAGTRLRQIDADCAGAGAEAFAFFRGLDADVWALLLTKQYEVFPHIRALLPDVPDPALQEVWNGASGVPLAAQSQAFYQKLINRFEQHSDWPVRDCRVLDFGCGWGRLTRFVARDVEPGRLYGCDPVEDILEVCRRSRLPATLARSDFVPERLPFDEPFELAFAFSVFTHLSEDAHLGCLRALHDGLRPRGLLVVTLRPPAYLQMCALMHPLLSSLSDGQLERPRYLFAPHATAPMQPPDASREPTYGEAVITMPYVRERWSELFEVLEVDLLVDDLYQVMLTLRRRSH